MIQKASPAQIQTLQQKTSGTTTSTPQATIAPLISTSAQANLSSPSLQLVTPTGPINNQAAITSSQNTSHSLASNHNSNILQQNQGSQYLILGLYLLSVVIYVAWIVYLMNPKSSTTDAEKKDHQLKTALGFVILLLLIWYMLKLVYW